VKLIKKLFGKSLPTGRNKSLNSYPSFMIRVQRKYKVLKHRTTKEMAEDVNRLIQHEYKDKEGFLFHSSGRWQCLGGVVYCEKEAMWVQSMVFIQEEDA
jgi:hypothetical protein